MELNTLEDLKKYKTIHLIGIGGISMSAIAEELKNWGFNVTGSDTTKSDLTDKLISHGISVSIGHDVEKAKSADLIVYSAAIGETDPERVAAKECGIPEIIRGDFVGYLTKLYKETICISGTHGKTTTTSMLSICFIKAHMDPTIEVGAILHNIGGNYRIGNSDFFILESCEYSASFLAFFPSCEVILNIDNDHLDFYKTFDNIVKAFNSFAEKLPDTGLLVTNADDENCLKLKEHTKAKFITYGIENKDANYVATNIRYDDDGFPTFDVLYNKQEFGTFSLKVTGIHNVLNALATIAVAHYYGIDTDIIKESFSEFTGAGRRVEYKGTLPNGAPVFDDYAHHPTEIKAVAKAIRNKSYNESWAIFQPHTYSRTKLLLDDFVDALNCFDHIVLVDIYAAREKNTYGISSKDLSDKINELYPEKSLYLPSFDDVVDYIKENAKEDDLVLTVGAGTVTNIGPMLTK